MKHRENAEKSKDVKPLTPREEALEVYLQVFVMNFSSYAAVVSRMQS
jgi:hypothetical protein